MRNAQVVENWINGKKARSGNGRLRTDGDKLFSFSLCIGEHREDKCVIYNFRGDRSVSLTTKRHVGIAVKHAGEDVSLIEPPAGKEDGIEMVARLNLPKEKTEAETTPTPTIIAELTDAKPATIVTRGAEDRVAQVQDPSAGACDGPPLQEGQ